MNSIDTVLNLYKDKSEIMVIGGAAVYRQFLPFTSKMYLTFIDHQFDGDTYFPKWQVSEWETIAESAIRSNLYSWRLLTLQRK